MCPSTAQTSNSKKSAEKSDGGETSKPSLSSALLPVRIDSDTPDRDMDNVDMNNNSKVDKPQIHFKEADEDPALVSMVELLACMSCGAAPARGRIYTCGDACEGEPWHVCQGCRGRILRRGPRGRPRCPRCRRGRLNRDREAESWREFVEASIPPPRAG